MAYSVDGGVVLQALTNACSQDPSLLKTAEGQLKELETHPGFYNILLTIYRNHVVNPNVRWLAVVCLKNGVDKYWRKSAPNALSDEEKEEIRKQLLLSFNEPVSQIASQLAVLISKVARLESKSWTALMPALSEGLQNTDAMYRLRSLLIFQHVVKMMASKKLSVDKENFRELASNTFDFMFTLWNSYMVNYFEQIQAQSESIHEAQEASMLSSKVLRKFMVHGFREFAPNSQPMSFLKKCLDASRQLLNIRQQLLSNQQISSLLEKLIACLVKVVLGTQEYHRLSCIPLLQDMLEFSAFYVFTKRGTTLVFEKLIIYCCNLMTNITKCETYKPPDKTKDAVDQIILKAHQIQKSFFTQAVLDEIIKTLVSHYFVLTREDLETWDSDPEEFDNEEVGESWRYQLRPSTEKLLLSLFREFRPLVTPVIVNIITSVQSLPESDDLGILMQKEAVYNVAGLCSYDLFEEINFEEWFSQGLVKELQNKSTGYRIIRRRVIWLIGQWINVKLSPPYRPMLYEIIVSLMSESEDLVVRLNTSKTLRSAVDDFEFRTEDFLPYLEACVSQLFKLLCDVKECDTKMHILFVMSMVIERVGPKIKPYVASLAGYLPKLWIESEEHNMLRCSILNTLTFIVKGLGSESVHLYSFLTPVIQLSTDVSQPPHVYLLEDGLELWSSTLKCAALMTPELLHLFHNMKELLELSSENLRTSFSIVESYILLGGLEFLQAWGQLVVTTCSNLLGNLKPEGNLILARIIEVVFRMFPSEGPRLFEPVLPKIFQAVVDGQEYGPLLAIYISLFAIILLKNKPYFDTFIQMVAEQCGKTVNELLAAFVDSWLERMDSITKTERRKLATMALCSLLPLKQEPVHSRFAVIVEITVDVLNELNKGDSYPSDFLLINPDDDEDEEDFDSQEHLRRKELNTKDPVFTVKLTKFVGEILQQCQQVFGEQNFQIMMASVESSVVNELQSFYNSER
ncbi:importin-11-like [Dendronephthya gigantea]|uniref:importin-11-like n=1 Tax=Dendronephthya gigantea TaxID=151771 RepID=UPI00106C4002|nr:importin-11-like [Dendronephthya gigantea]